MQDDLSLSEDFGTISVSAAKAGSTLGRRAPVQANVAAFAGSQMHGEIDIVIGTALATTWNNNN